MRVFVIIDDLRERWARLLSTLVKNWPREASRCLSQTALGLEQKMAHADSDRQ